VVIVFGFTSVNGQHSGILASSCIY